jgi:hypothetical protein
LLAAGALVMARLCQFGLLRRMPEPCLPFLGATPPSDYSAPETRWSWLDEQVRWTLPWVPRALAAKIAADARGGLYLTDEQISKHRKVCWWRTAAALAQLDSPPIALPDAQAAVRLAGRS